MAKSRPTITKRLRERAKMEKRRRKAERAAERQVELTEEEQLAQMEAEEAGLDPDIAHIVPGPQPLPEWMVDDTEVG